ncbi:twin arginine-targeting protein translocase TatB [Acidihalobacter yilgarnensis]|uniref:Sec-independent protein translocase protein TatB n=1 Tax=Acidihalobacter yilgarnensis TaxID=2819280 RepID=A0A1D8IJV4_9GAMM|nr:Sec-independent protein translocase protein TatB [Acidihalobacter yilgarnensis]AOU96742.1 twin arginine-targeting protein translocase TatB [Acidihalobacter yilgarnensis]
MFDSGFSELMLIMIVALVVVGPERLPGLVRKIGYWVGRFRRYATTVRAEIERELNADELRNMLTRQEDEIRELRDMLQDTREQMLGEVDDIAGEVRKVGESPADPAAVKRDEMPGPAPVHTLAEESEFVSAASRHDDNDAPATPVDDVEGHHEHVQPAQDRVSIETSPVDKTTHGRKSE